MIAETDTILILFANLATLAAVHVRKMVVQDAKQIEFLTIVIVLITLMMMEPIINALTVDSNALHVLGAR